MSYFVYFNVEIHNAYCYFNGDMNIFNLDIQVRNVNVLPVLEMR